MQRQNYFEIILRDGHTSKRFSKVMSFEDLTPKAFEAAIKALDRQVQNDRNQQSGSGTH